jgi:hypothetical protein
MVMLAQQLHGGDSGSDYNFYKQELANKYSQYILNHSSEAQLIIDGYYV